jgi:anti-anti-sigma factor
MIDGGFMDITTEKENSCIIVSVKGKVDAVTSPAFEKVLSGLIENGEHRLLLNLSALEYISSAGLRSILAMAKRLKAKEGKMVFSGLQGSVKEVFKISGFGSIFQISETPEEARKLF